jgi:DNA-binding transcriptional ArsR family regulator
MHDYASAAALFKTLADPTRLGVLEQIFREGRVTVTHLAAGFPVSQPAISQHLKVLRQAGLVREEKEGRNVWYSAAPDGLKPVSDWLAHYTAFWTEHFDAFEQLLKDMDQ